MTTEVSTRVIMLDGDIVPEAEAQPLLDDGLVRGDGVFEGMRLYDRRPRTPGAHMDRLALSARNIALPIDVDLLWREFAEFCRAVSVPDCGLRLMLTRGGHRIWREEPLIGERESITVAPQPHRVSPLLIGAKTLSYAPNMQALRRAKAEGCDDAVMIRADDRVVLEGPVTAFAWLEGDVLWFPPLSAGVLDSLTRRIAQTCWETKEREATVDELASADGALLMNTLFESVAIREIAGVGTYDPANATLQAVRAAIHEATLAAVEAV